MSQQKPLLILAGVVILSIAILVLITTLSKRAKEAQKPEVTTVSKEARAQTVLSAVPSKREVRVGETFTIDVVITTGDNLVNGVELYLDYDPSILAIDEVKEGDFFSKPIPLGSSKNTAEGLILFALGSIDGKKGTGTVVKLSARAVGRTSGSVEVLTIKPTTLISGFDSKNSVLKEVKGASIVIR